MKNSEDMISLKLDTNPKNYTLSLNKNIKLVNLTKPSMIWMNHLENKVKLRPKMKLWKLLKCFPLLSSKKVPSLIKKFQI